MPRGKAKPKTKTVKKVEVPVAPKPVEKKKEPEQNAMLTIIHGSNKQDV